MRIRVVVKDIRLGMFIESLEGKWLDHPFWRRRFLLEDPADLQALQSSKVPAVIIDLDKGLAPLDEAPELTTNEMEIVPAEIEEEPPVTAVSCEAELANAEKIIDRSKPIMRELFEDIRMGRALEMQDCLSIVDEVSQSVSRNASALTGLLRLKTQDEYTYMHSVAVCALMAAMAIELNLSPEQVREAALAGLMHDLGKALMPLSVLNKPGRLTEQEFEIMRGHPEQGYKLLQQLEGLPVMVLDVCLHHHEKMDGSGYPHRLKGTDISLLARMGAICDVYDAVTSERPYKSPWQAADALSHMASWAGHFDQDLFRSFIRCVGIYPLGSLVRLASGRLAVVIEQNSEQLVKPVVKVFYSVKFKAAIPIERLNLADSIRGEAIDAIVSRETPEKWGLSAKRLEQLWTV